MNIIRELHGHQTAKDYKQEKQNTIMEKEYKIVIPESNSQMVIDSLLDILSKQSKLIEDLESSKKQLSKTCAELRADKEELLPLKERLNSIETELNAANYLVSKYKEEMNQLADVKKSLSEERSSKEQIEVSLAILKTEYTALQSKNCDLLHEIQAVQRKSTESNYLIGLKESELKTVKDELEEKRKNNDSLSNDIKRLLENKSDLETQVAALTSKKDEIERKATEYEEKFKSLSEQLSGFSKHKYLYLTSVLNKIGAILDSEVESIQNDWLKTYVTDILTSGTSDVPSLRQIANLGEDRVANLVSYGNTSITKLANLLWWYTWTELKDIVREISRIKEIDFYFREVLLPYLETFYDIEVHMPNVNLDANLSNYEKDTRTPTTLKDLKVENFSIRNNTKCEISTLSYNNKPGICYVAYEIGN